MCVCVDVMIVHRYEIETFNLCVEVMSACMFVDKYELKLVNLCVQVMSVDVLTEMK